MKFNSTRLSAPQLSFEEVLLQGLANDGGLYVPEFLPIFDQKKLNEMNQMNYQDLFFEITRHFVEHDIKNDEYREIVKKSYQTFNHKAIAPLKQIDYNHFLLELFHGPTLAFKDFALQLLGNLLDYFLQKNGQKVVIVGATSGDTGSAAIYGCANCKNAEIFIMHPHQKVSDVQRKQMTSFLAPNVFNLAIKGNFDDCQSIVKRMFVDQSFLKGKKMVAVNSINFTRIMAQIVYYFYAALRLGCSDGKSISFSVPSGNFGDIYAGYLAKKMGLNINKLIVATNANNILLRFFEKNDYSKTDMIETISPSMNIQVASNFERLLYDLHKMHKQESKMPEIMRNFEINSSLKIDSDIHKSACKDFTAFDASDEETKAVIANYFTKTGEILDPHTAIGVFAAEKFMKTKNYEKELVVTLATAHPAKFPEAVFEAIGKKPELPNFLADLDSRPEKFTILPNDFEEICRFISLNC